MRDWVSVGDGGVIQGSVIPARMAVTWGLLRNHVLWVRLWTGGRADDVKFQHALKLLAGNTQVLRGQTA